MLELLADIGTLPPERAEVVRTWAQSLRAACDAIGTVSKCGPATITVAGRLRGSPWEGRLLRALSEVLARQYDLCVTVILAGDSFTTRFDRRSAQPLDP